MRINATATALLTMIWLAGCATDPSHVPELGRYAFAAQWPVSGFNQPATVIGELQITAASEAEISWTLTLTESFGPVTKSGTGGWTEENGYLLTSGNVGRAGTWFLLPHFDRGKSGYTCYGNAFNVGASFGTPMTCSFTKS